MDTERIEELVSEFVERRERGETLDPETFAREHPDAGQLLLKTLRTLTATEELFPSDSPDLPANVGPYRVLGEIGRGGMGRVFDARHPERPTQPIALKLLHLSVGNQPRSLERFRREGEALERLDHPGIVGVVEAGLLDKRPFLAMEKVEGVPLADLLCSARERVPAGERPVGNELELPGEGSPLERAVRLVARLARALAAAHREGVLHRDVNPRNVLVRPDGKPVLIDFGLMRSSGDPTLTGSGDLLGTPQYMAPEQARGENVDERTDVFGLGTILWEVLLLAPTRSAESMVALLRKAANQPLTRSKDCRTGVPAELMVVLKRSTSFFRRWRTPSCEALGADLERWLEGEPILARAPSLLVRVLEAAHYRKRTTVAAAVGVLALSMAFLSWYVRPDEDRSLRLVRGTTSVVLPWMAGDLPETRAALDAFVETEGEVPFLEFLEGLALGEFARETDDLATRAMLQGERLRRSGHPAQARACFNTAWDVFPGYPMVVLFQGLAALESGDLEAARDRFEFAAYTFGQGAQMHRLLGQVYERLELWPDATRALTAAVALDPRDAGSHVALARLHRASGEHQTALDAAMVALELDAEATRGELEELARALVKDGENARAAKLREALLAR
jgi:serine/threonine protein kinase